jgi:ankyrin repeat protein
MQRPPHANTCRTRCPPNAPQIESVRLLDRQAVFDAARAGDVVALARMLLDAGADPDIRDAKYAATALGWVDFFGRADFAKLVRERGGHK